MAGLVYLILSAGLGGIVLFLRWLLRGRTGFQNIPGPPSPSFWTGNLSQLLDRHGWAFHRSIAEDYGSVVRLGGILNRPLLYVSDPKALNKIVLDDQHVYDESHAFIAMNNLVFGPGLISTLGDHHRKQRKLLNPVFAVGHMRNMLPVFYAITSKLERAIAAQLSTGPREVDVMDWMGRTALELVGQGGLGYSFDPLVEATPNAFGDALKSLLPALFEVELMQRLSPYFTAIGSPAFRRRILDMIPYRRAQKLKTIVDTMHEKAYAIFNAKKSAMQSGDEAVLQQFGEGTDAMSILMRANLDVAEGQKMPDHELIAQMVTLIFGAMDTTSKALSQVLHVLATHPDVQEKLRQEIVTARDGGDLSFDELMQLPLLDAVFRETLRLYPSAFILSREARRDIVMPLSEPVRGRDGKMLHEIFIPKDTQVLVGVLGSNCNKTLWGEDAFEWKPERWLSPLPKALTDAHIPGVYSSLMTFMGGLRGCIGFKFAELEMKAVVYSLLPSFLFEVPKEPIVWNIAIVTYPTMGNGTEPKMMLKMSALKSNSA